MLGAPALPRVQSLRDKSLLRASPRDPGGAARFSLYEGVRELGAEKLVERADVEAGAAAHAAHYLAVGEAAAGDWERTGTAPALDRIQDDLENLLAVGERALDGAPGRPPARRPPRGAARALLIIDPVLSTRGPFGIHLELLDRALDAARATGADPLLGGAHAGGARVARYRRGNDAAGLDDLTRARERAAALGATSVEAGILTELGVLHQRRREMDRVRACYEEALALHRRSGNRRAEGRVLGNLGALHHDERRFLDEAMPYYEAALSIAAAAGDLRVEGNCCNNIGSHRAGARRLGLAGAAALRARPGHPGRGRRSAAPAASRWATWPSSTTKRVAWRRRAPATSAPRRGSARSADRRSRGARAGAGSAPCWRRWIAPRRPAPR